MSAGPDFRRTPVLVADDNADILDLVSYRLETAGYAVIKAEDGEQAVRRAIEHAPKLCLLDLKMPKLDGLEVTRALRAHPDVHHTQVVLMTAARETVDMAVGYEAGVNVFLMKPFTPAELLDSVASALEGA